MTEIETIQLVWIIFSLITFLKWLKRYDLGHSSLAGVDMPGCSLGLPDVIIGLLVFLLIPSLTPYLAGSNSSFFFKVGIMACLNLVTIEILALLLNQRFTQKLNAIFPAPKQIPHDIFHAICYSVPAFGLAALALTVTISICSLFGYDTVQQHEFLTELEKNKSDITGIIIMYFSVAMITPVVEELLFRGLIQTTLINITQSKWLGIFITSAIFAVMHASPQHWPALFILSCCFGYAFVKQKSILVSVLMHAAFNALNITGQLIGLGQ